MTQDTDKQAPSKDAVQREGGDIGETERSFAGKNKPAERKAREAADALEEPEAEALEEARRSTGKGKIHTHPDAGGADDPHTERQLDSGLEETFPASDPVSISPGAD